MLRRQAVWRSVGGASRVGKSAAVPAAAPPLAPLAPLPLERVVEFREKGYLVLDNFFDAATLARYGDVVRAAAVRRGPKLVFPNPDSNCYELDVTVKGHVPSDDGKQRNIARRTARVYTKSERRLQRMYRGLKRRTEAAQKAGERVKVVGDGGGGDGRSAADNMTADQIQEAHDEFVRSESFQREVVRKMRVRDLTRFFEAIMRPWFHVWHGDEQLAALLTEASSSSSSSRAGAGAGAGVGRRLAQVAGEAAGVARVRLFTDLVSYRCAWGNAMAMRCSQPHVDFNDYRATTVTVVLPTGTGGAGTGGGVALTRDNGGYVVVDGSHHVMRRLTANAADSSFYKQFPGAWDFGEVLRKHADAFGNCKLRQLSLPVGSVLLSSSQLVWGQVPNYGASEALTHTMYMMPDGAVHNGQKHSWLSRDKEGPLAQYVAGDALNDDALFPMLYSAVDDF